MHMRFGHIEFVTISEYCSSFHMYQMYHIIKVNNKIQFHVRFSKSALKYNILAHGIVSLRSNTQG